MTTFTLEELAHYLGAEASEIPGPEITGARPLEYATENEITYVAGERFLGNLASSKAGAVIIPPGLDPGKIPHIFSGNPEAAFSRLTALYYPYPQPYAGISPRAEVHPEAALGKDVSVGAFAVVGRRVKIGDRCVIGSNVVIEQDVEVGEDTRVFPNVTIYARVKIGKRVIVHAGTVIGSDGFGFARDSDPNGAPITVKKYHSGTVEIGDDVEIGALCAIDRALAGTTRLGNGVKLDNLIQIAHNVEIGDGTVIAAQVGIAGSSSIGKFGMVGGQVGVRDHVSVGNGVILATRVGIYRDVPDGQIMAGSVPPMPHKVFLRAQPLFKRLPEMLARIRKLERTLQTAHKEKE
jgi:UDP-3-O-[3-hydroxymyristoyl] glucosamine N-acyltransferase